MYLCFNERKIEDFSDKNIESHYNDGYVFTRKNKGVMNETRSVRINLDKFALSSENKRILRKTDEIKLRTENIPLSDYKWQIHKMGKDFYTTKFGDKTFSANKIKELLNDKEKSNFNICFTFADKKIEGYCIAMETKNIVHYSYPFYNLKYPNKNIGMGMMLKAIIYAKKNNKTYLYLGSASRPTDIYKLQFKGLEWFDKEKWNTNTDALKQILKSL